MPTSNVMLGSAKSANLWTGKLLIDEWDKLALVRNVGLDSMGVLKHIDEFSRKSKYPAP